MRKKPAQRRAPRGSGTIFYSATRRVWIARVPIGRVDGRTKYREVSHAKQSTCLQLKRQLEPPGEATTVGEFAEKWLEGLHVRPSTYENYANSVRVRIVPTIGHMRLAEVTPLQVEHTARDWQKIYATGTVRLTLAHLSMVFKAALRAEVITRNPVALAKKPRPDARPFHVYPPQILADIVQAATARPWGRALAVLAGTGMRSGECVALEVSDFDRTAGTLSITKTYGRRRPPGPPKTRNSVRTIRVPSDALPAVVAAAGTRRTGPLFLRMDGTGLTKGTLDWEWAKLCKRMGIVRYSIHTLRHSFISALVAAGVPLADAARYVGHTVSELVKTYTHQTGADVTTAVEALFRKGKRTAKTRG